MNEIKSGAVLVLSSLLLACGGGGGSAATGDVAMKTETLPQASRLEAQPLSSIDPDQASDADLAAFGEAIGDARIVVLNESDHAVGETLRLTARLTQYLHKHKNFEVFLVESSLFDLQRMKEMKKQLGVSYLDSAPGRIFWGTSRTVDGRKLVKYLDDAAMVQKPLELTGIDVMMGGESSMYELFPRFEAFLTKNGSSLPSSANWPVYKKYGTNLAKLEQRYIERPNGEERAIFKQVGAQLKQELCFTPYAGEAILSSKGYWCRVVNSFDQQLDYLWRYSDMTLDWDARDLAQAENAAWFLEGPYKDKKAIVFTHASHGVQNLVPSIIPGNTGSGLAKRYPGQIHTVMISAKQVLDENGFYKEFTGFTAGNSLEAVLFPKNELGYISYSAAIEDKAAKSPYMLGGNFRQVTGRFFGPYVQTMFYIPQQKYSKVEWERFPGRLWPQPLD